MEIDAVHQLRTELSQDQELTEVVRTDRDIRHFSGDGGAVTDGNAHIRLGEGRGVVDAVADHDHGVSSAALRLHKGSLVIGQNFRVELVDVQRRGDRLRGAPVVTGHHADFADAKGVELIDDLRGLRAQRVKNAQHCDEHAVQRQVQVGVGGRELLKLVLLARRHSAALILKNKVVASDQSLLAVYGRGNAVGDDILHLGVHFVVYDAALRSFPDHRVGDGVRVVLLQAGGQTQALGLIGSAEGHYFDNFGGGMSQCAGLIEHNRVRFGGSFQEFPSLDRDIALAGLADGGEHGERHGELESAGEVHHEERQRPVCIACQKPGEYRASQAVRNQAVRQVESFCLRVGLELFGFFDHADDLVIFAASGGLRHFDHGVAFLDDGARVDIAAGGFCDRNGFSGHGSLVDRDLALDDLAVQRNDIGRVDDDLVAGLYAADIGQDLAALGAEPHFVDLEGHGPCQVIHRLAVRPFFQHFAYGEQEHDRGGRREVAPRHGRGNGGGIQNGDVQFPAQKAIEALGDKADASQDRPGTPQRGGKKETSEPVSGHQHDQLFFILPAERPSGLLRDQLRGSRVVVVKAAQGVNDVIAPSLLPAVADDRVAGPVIDLDIRDEGLVSQVVFEQVGLLKSHSPADHMHAHAPGGLM